MCYAIPGKVENIDNKFITVDYFGEKKRAINELDNLTIGDYIYAQGGYAIEKIPPGEALSILSIWKETFFELQEVDLKLSVLKLEEEGQDNKLLPLLDKASRSEKLTDEELLYLLSINKTNSLELLYKTANFLRQKFQKNSCCVHGIIEFSNHCTQSCLYCGLSIHNRQLPRYNMSDEQLIETAYTAVTKYGFKALVLQSGEDNKSIDELCTIIRKIKEKTPVLLFISIGETTTDDLKKIYQAGARGILMRFETSNQQLYKKLHPGKKLESRIKLLEDAYKTGFLIITGSLLGIPGQTYQDIITDIKLAKKLHTEMYSFGPFIPHPQTPLANSPQIETDLILKVLAIARINDPENAKILVTTAFETIDRKAREKGLLAGANSVMLNVTPGQQKKNYSIYPNKAYTNTTIQEQIKETITLLKNLGRAPTDLGF